VITVVQRKLAVQRVDWKEPLDPTPCIPQVCEKLPPGASGPHIVDKQPYLDPTGCRTSQGVTQATTRTVPLPDVINEMYMVLRPFECRFQGVECDRAIPV